MYLENLTRTSLFTTEPPATGILLQPNDLPTSGLHVNLVSASGQKERIFAEVGITPRQELHGLRLTVSDSYGELLFNKCFKQNEDFESQLRSFLAEFQKLEERMCHSKGFLLPREVNIDSDRDLDFREVAFAVVDGHYEEGNTHVEILESLLGIVDDDGIDRPDLAEFEQSHQIALGEIVYVDGQYVTVVEGDTMKNITEDELMCLEAFSDGLVYIEQSSTGWLKPM